MVAISLEMLKEILAIDKMHVKLLPESDGTVTAVLEELDLEANVPTEELVIQALARDAIDYANDFYNEFSYWYSAPNRRAHLAHVLAILAYNPQNVSKELFVCQAGEI